MARHAKTPKTPGFMRTILAANLINLLAHHYRHLPNVTLRQRELEKDSTIRLSTIQRLVKQETGANLETLELLAGAFQLSVYQLLTPNLEAGNPQVIKGASKAEQHFYTLFQKAQRTGKKMFVLEDVTPARQRQVNSA